MAAVIMHHFSGLAAPFVRSKGTVSGGVFTKPAKTLDFSRVLCYNLRMEKIKELPEKSEEMVTISRAEYEALQAKLSAKEEELVAALLKNQWLLEQLRLNRKKQYGSSSEYFAPNRPAKRRK